MAKLKAEQEQQQQQQQQEQQGQQQQQSNGHAKQQEAEQPAAVAGAAEHSIAVRHLDFAYPGLDGRPIPGRPPLITDMCLELQPGSRCLLIGANGAGKTTLLKILAGKHMVPREQVLVLGRPPFHDTELTTSGHLAYVGGNWTRDIAFAGTSIPLTGDFPARKMIDAVPAVSEERKQRLMSVLDVDPAWRMHQVSDGQRRRVQICVGLLRPFKVLLLDEITVDLDVLGRADLMRFLVEECAARGASIIYATHIFDGLEFWPTHVAYVARGQLQFCQPASSLPQLAQGQLLEMVTGLLRQEKQAMQAAGIEKPLEYDPAREGEVDAGFSYVWNNGWVPGTLGTSLAHGTNAVMRM
ncbi:hypothetical protein OEZ86_011381 [Tetradesmus obliquus]|nr:hypothetical protein OEZ86_011381 [Tetradesmus obliquus]